MYNYPVYKLIKQRVKDIAATFYFLGQYEKGKDNTSYKVPAIYIEMPANGSTRYNGRRQRSVKGNIRIHYISNAPFKNHDNTVQDAALAAHHAQLKALDDLLQGWVAVDADSKKLTQQFLQNATTEMRFLGSHVVSILQYGTEITTA